MSAMRNFRTPGVYVRDVEVKPPPRVRMDVTGFVGQAERGPLNSPQPLTSWGEYLDIFGGFVGYGYLPYCVFTFFGNGGEKCYAVRVAHETARKAKAALWGAFAVTGQTLAGLRADAVPEDVLGNIEGLSGRTFGGPDEFLAALASAVGDAAVAAFKQQFLERAGRRLVGVEAINEGAWGDGVEVVAESYSSDDFVLTELAGELAAGEEGGVRLTTLAGLRGETAGKVRGDAVKLIHPKLPTQQEQFAVRQVLPDEGAAVFDRAAGRSFPAGTRVLGKGFKLTFRLTLDGQFVRGEVFDNLSADPAHERYFVRVINGDPEEPDYLKRLRDGASILVRVSDPTLADARRGPRIPDQTARLSGGSDGEREQVGRGHYTGYQGEDYFRPAPPTGAEPDEINRRQREFYGLSALEAVDEIGLVAIPDLILPDLCDSVPRSMRPEQGVVFAETLKTPKPFERLKDGQAEMLFHCRKMGERSAILDSPRGAQIGKGENRIEEWPTNFQLLPAAKYGALYYPWVRQKAADFAGRELFIPPCGVVAGVYSRSEQARGVGKAPANETLQGAVALEFCVDDDEQGVLNPKGVNCLRIFPGRGLRVWGARTLSPDPPSIYVNVRRVVLSVIKNLLVTLRPTVFEPNGPQLRDEIRGTLNIFLNGLFESGALAGASPREAYFVKCDAENNPPETFDLGQIITEIGFAPERPAEFVLVTIKRSPGALSVLER